MSGAALEINSPEHGAIAPPGYYLLFVVSNTGVPSEARYVRLPVTIPQPPPPP
jgi:hypothetical protein